MADEMDEQLQQYINLWDNIKNREFNSPLPEFDINEKLTDFSKELKTSFSSDKDTGSTIFKHLDTIHKITYQLHILRDIMYRNNSILYMKGFLNDP
jgi:reverse gyrase